MSKDKFLYFKNLDGLRFFAALCVVVGHCQAILNDNYHIKTYVPYVSKLGTFGVDFFFVLSGFLISFLLMVELEKTDTIQVKHFYYRRFLRIWPLYFGFGIFWILIGTWQMRYFGTWLTYEATAQSGQMMALNLAFLGTFSINFQALLQLGNPFQLGHFWSLGVEEQFYLIWAPVFKRFKKHLLPVILTFIGIGLLLNLPYKTFFFGLPDFQYNFTANCFFQFGLGGLLAWWLHNGFFTHLYPLSKRAAWTLQICFLVPMLLYLMGNFFIDDHYHARQHLVNSLLSAGIIGCAIAPHSVLFFEVGWLKYLGKISFGLYVFHIAAVRVAEKLLTAGFGIKIDSPQYLWLYPTVATLIAIAFAALSYEFFEKQFLKLKDKFR